MRRAMALAGADGATLALAARAAAQAGELKLAAEAWRRVIEADQRAWEKTVDSAVLYLTPEQLLDGVIPAGARLAVEVGARLSTISDGGPVRELFFSEALKRLPDDHGVGGSERLRLEAVARAGLGERNEPRRLWESALTLDPRRGDWRHEYVSWLLERGDLESAYRHALLGNRIDPGDARMRHAGCDGRRTRPGTSPQAIESQP